ncbi:hypothetical protein Tco_1100134 [Tanacetum coccineum]
MVVEEGVLAELTGTGIVGAGEIDLLTRGDFRSHRLRQLIELNVNSFHDSSGSFVVDSITLPAWCITNENFDISYWL